MFNDEILIMPGGAIKSRGREVKNGIEYGKVSGVLCRFTSKDDTDWYGDFFDENTDFRFVEGMACPVYFDHALSEMLGVRVFGTGVLKLGAEGIEIEAEMELADDHAIKLFERVIAGEMQWSSGTAGHLVKRTQVKSYSLHGESAYHIDHWPLGLDASLTAHAAEERNVATVMKSLKSFRSGGDLVGNLVGTHQVTHQVEPTKSVIDAIQREALLLEAEMLALYRIPTTDSY